MGGRERHIRAILLGRRIALGRSAVVLGRRRTTVSSAVISLAGVIRHQSGVFASGIGASVGFVASRCGVCVAAGRGYGSRSFELSAAKERESACG